MQRDGVIARQAETPVSKQQPHTVNPASRSGGTHLMKAFKGSYPLQSKPSRINAMSKPPTTKFSIAHAFAKKKKLRSIEDDVATELAVDIDDGMDEEAKMPIQDANEYHIEYLASKEEQKTTTNHNAKLESADCTETSLDSNLGDKPPMKTTTSAQNIAQIETQIEPIQKASVYELGHSPYTIPIKRKEGRVERKPCELSLLKIISDSAGLNTALMREITMSIEDVYSRDLAKHPTILPCRRSKDPDGYTDDPKDYEYTGTFGQSKAIFVPTTTPTKVKTNFIKPKEKYEFNYSDLRRIKTDRNTCNDGNVYFQSGPSIPSERFNAKYSDTVVDMDTSSIKPIKLSTRDPIPAPTNAKRDVVYEANTEQETDQPIKSDDVSLNGIGWVLAERTSTESGTEGLDRRPSAAPSRCSTNRGMSSRASNRSRVPGMKPPPVEKLGGLGPDRESDAYREKVYFKLTQLEKYTRAKSYSKLVRLKLKKRPKNDGRVSQTPSITSQKTELKLPPIVEPDFLGSDKRAKMREYAAGIKKPTVKKSTQRQSSLPDLNLGARQHFGLAYASAPATPHNELSELEKMHKQDMKAVEKLYRYL